MIDLEQGVKWAILVSESTTTSIEFLVLIVGRSVMKSIAIDPQGRLGIDRGYKSLNYRSDVWELWIEHMYHKT